MFEALAGAWRRIDSKPWLRRAAIASAALLLLWAVAWISVPPIVKGQAEQRLSALLGRPVTIARVSFAPWSLALTVEQLRVGSAVAGEPPQLEIGRLYVNAELSSLLRLAPVVQALHVDAPRLRLARVADGRYDIDDILARLKPANAPKSDTEPARFAVYNLRLEGGELLFDDRPVRRQHKVEGLQIGLPFLSNLPADVEVLVAPHLAFRLNGAGFDSGGQAHPFAKDHNATLKLAITKLDLAPWLAYVPAELPIKPARGVFDGQLEVQFALAADGTPKVGIAGQAALADAAFVAGPGSEPALAWRRLAVGLKDVQPLARRIGLGSVRLEGARVDLRRGPDGTFNLAPGRPVADAVAPAASAASAPAPATRGTWQLSVDKVELAGAQVDWHDATTRPAAALRVDALDFAAGPLRWPTEPGTDGAPVQLQGRLAPPDGAASAATFSVQGRASEHAAQATLSLDGLDLRWLAPYVAVALEPMVEGRLQARTQLEWAAAGDASKLALTALGLQLDALRIVDPRADRKALPAVSVASVAVADAQLDLLARKLSLGSVKVDRPTLRLGRAKQGRINALAWVREGAGNNAGAKPAASTGPGWQVFVNDAQLSGGDLGWIDEQPAPGATEAARLRATAVNARVQGLAWPGVAGGAAARTQLSLRLADGDAAPPPGTAANVGRVEWNGQVTATPLSVRGTLRAERLPAHALSPYVDSGLPIDLLRAEATWRGELAFVQRGEAIEASAKGDALIGDLRVHERPAAGAANAVRGGDELLTWQSFALTGVQFRMAPGSQPSLAIGEAALTDFYSRLVITEDGHFNLRDVAATPRPADTAASAAPASAPVAAASAPPAPAAAASGLPIDISVGGVRLANGKVDFTDRFIKPNYSAALTELNGRLGAFSSTTRDMATLDLRGRAAGTALLEIAGSLNPTARPLALDIRAKATDLELAPFSPYAGRYAGYAIERGKLSMDVAYKIDADGKLDARNQVILNQLTFGDKVESPDATKLPVLLAVALLKDRNGVIDINLPISGSINDPQFSVFGIVLKIIGNLLVKALTAPFALLAGGGSDDLSYVAFEPGTARVSEPGRGVLDKVAKALTDRPALKMTVAGASDPVSERDAMQRAALDTRIAAEQRRDALRAGAAADAALPPLTPTQRDNFIQRLYSDTRLPNKPRNAIGLARDIPVPEMEALLRGATQVSTDSARELALQRGLAVRDALVAKGLPSERLFIAAPRLRASGEDDAAWSPRVQLTLSTN